MLEVYPIQQKSEQKELCELAGIVYDVNKLAYKGIISGELIGVAQFGIKGKCGYIYDLENIKGIDNDEVLFVIGRAALNFIDLCGIVDVYFEARSEDREALVARIGFKKDENGKWYMNTDGFFTGPCKCEG
ncbi:MAG: hypothetical protein IJA55_05825 [Clostridia bacterium]|nr:hypothetical protein [Clostridia bacterium]